MQFSPEYLYRQLQSIPPPAGWQVAVSGGLDSTVLLHALVQLRSQLGVTLGAVHVNHGLQAAAADWQAHCRDTCRRLDIPLQILAVDATAAPGESPEAAARDARYAALAAWLPAGHALLTAQHRDDQAETLLLQLVRGAGVHGLAGMPVSAALGGGRLVRPLLEVPRAALQAYATAHDLQWVDDPSNADTRFDRNYLRHHVLPRLAARWPAADEGLARSAANLADAVTLLDERAVADLSSIAGRQDETVSVARLLALPPARRRNVLRHWLKARGGLAPSRAVLARILHDVLGCRGDAQPAVSWGDCTLRRYRDDLYVLRPGDLAAGMPVRRWSPPQPLAFPASGAVLRASRVSGAGLRRAVVDRHGLEVRWRRGGERCRPHGRAHHHALKKLFQEAGVPPWARQTTPLLYVDGALAAVGGLWVCEPFAAAPGEAGYRIHWERAPAAGRHDAD